MLPISVIVLIERKNPYTFSLLPRTLNLNWLHVIVVPNRRKVWRIKICYSSLRIWTEYLLLDLSDSIQNSRNVCDHSFQWHFWLRVAFLTLSAFHQWRFRIDYLVTFFFSQQDVKTIKNTTEPWIIPSACFIPLSRPEIYL